MYLHIKEEHDLVANDLLTVPFEEFFEFFNQKALDKLMVFRNDQYRRSKISYRKDLSRSAVLDGYYQITTGLPRNG